MSPTIVFNAAGYVELVTGSPGGSRIIGYTAQSVINHVDFGLDPQLSVATPHYLNRKRGLSPLSGIGIRVNIVHPVHLFRLLNHRYLEIHHDGFLTTAAQHARQRFVLGRVDFLVWHVGRNVDEIAGPSLGHELKILAPSHARLATDNINDAFNGAVVVGPRLRIGMDDDRTGPQLFGPAPRMGDGRGAVHPRCLRRIGIEIGALDDTHAVVFPFRLGFRHV